MVLGAPFLSAPSISTSTSRWKHIPFEKASASSANASDVDDASPRRAHCGQRTPTHAKPMRAFSLRTSSLKRAPLKMNCGREGSGGE